MSSSQTFNLCDEAWIPINTGQSVSLKDVFAQPDLAFPAGNPVQKIAVFKLLLAIAQAACTPTDEADWEALSPEDFRRRCLEYLDKWHDRFDLYGERPFLQMPSVSKAKVLPFEALCPEKASGNTTRLTQLQNAVPLTDADKALLLVQTMNFAFGGKKADNSIVLSSGYTGKSKSGRPGPSLGSLGYLHSFALVSGLARSLWLNLMSLEDIRAMQIFPQGPGKAPWEEMPKSEDCEVAEVLRQSLIGRLMPLSRFCLLTEQGMHCTEGLAYNGPKEGGYEPSMTVELGAKEIKPILVNPEKRPWRSLTAILSFMHSGAAGKTRFDTRQMAIALGRVGRRALQDEITIWSGGMRVSAKAGEQYMSGSNDYVESECLLSVSMVVESWYLTFMRQMALLDAMSSALYGAVMGYYQEFKVQGKQRAAQAANRFWLDAEAGFQDLVDACALGEEALKPVHADNQKRFINAYNEACPHETPRQVIAWVKHMKKDKNND